MTTVDGCDISNYNGELSPEFIACLKASGIEHVCVRASLETTAKSALANSQLTTLLDAGLSVSVYVWMYFSWSPEVTVQRAVDLFGWASPPTYWFDCEETGDIGTPAQNADWLTRAFAEIDRQGVKGGIYTGAWWWEPHMAGSTAFADRPLWTAQYDNIPDLAAFIHYGGWAQATGKQYTGTGALCGVNPIDLDTFAIGEAPMPGEPEAERLNQAIQARNALGRQAVALLAQVFAVDAPQGGTVSIRPAPPADGAPTSGFVAAPWIVLGLAIAGILADQIIPVLKTLPANSVITAALSVLVVISGSVPLIQRLLEQQHANAMALLERRAQLGLKG